MSGIFLAYAHTLMNKSVWTGLIVNSARGEAFALRKYLGGTQRLS